MCKKKPILLQINVVQGVGSTGRIVEDIGILAKESLFKSYIAYGRRGVHSSSIKLKIGNKFDVYSHVIQTRIFDTHGLCSKSSTKTFVKNVREINPDIIHLHNIHGYYLNYPLLFKCLKELNIPVLWTLHDCWSFTGHCAHFESMNCDKWKSGCFNCIQRLKYPTAFFHDNSSINYRLKFINFNSLPNLTLVPVSNWLSSHLQNSFLRSINKVLIYNGVDVDVFKPYALDESRDFSIIGVSGIWNDEKGLADFITLRNLLNESFKIILVGLSSDQIKRLPRGICGIERTENIHQLAELYSSASVFINPTYEDTFPTVNLESLACGTPVITYNTGGSPEAVTPETGFVVEKGDIQGLVDCINIVKDKGKAHYSTACRERAIKHFNKDDRYQEYIDLYKSLLNKK